MAHWNNSCTAKPATPFGTGDGWFKIDIGNAKVCRKCDTFLETYSGGTPFHASAWGRLIQKMYGAECWTLACERNGKFVALLPLYKIKSLWRKELLISIPHAPCGGLISNDRFDALPKAKPPYNKVLELLSPSAHTLRTANSPWKRITMVLELANSAEELWKSFKSEVRNRVRKAEKKGLEIAVRENGLPAFYPLYLKRMHELGTPPHRKEFFQALAHEFKDRIEYVLAFHQNKPVGGLLDLNWGKRRYNLYGATDTGLHSLCANDLMYWHSIKRAIGAGLDYYNLGRSQIGSGPYFFKKKWGAQEKSIEKYVWKMNPKTSELQRMTTEPSVRWSTIWKRFPFFVTVALGTRLRKYVY